MEVAGRKVETDKTTSSDFFCEPCQVENKKTKANGACRECKEYMCTTCFQHHLKGKLCRNHAFLPTVDFSLMSLNSSTEDVEKCEEHDNERIKFYCRAHDIVGCGDCIVLGHATCKPEYIKDVAKTFRNGDKFKSVEVKLKQLEKYQTENEKKIQKNKKDIELMNEKALNKIRQFRSEINIYLDKAEANILSRVGKLATEDTEIQKKLEDVSNVLKSEFEEVKQKLNTQIHHGDALFINATRCKSILDDIEKEQQKINQANVLKRFEFFRDKSISGILQAAQEFGEVRRFKTANFAVGSRVRRGPDWKKVYGDQGGGGLGTVKGFDGFYGLAHVTWDNGGTYYYRFGDDDAFDLEIV